MDKLYAIQDVFISVQSVLDDVASYGERMKKWVSWLGGGGAKARREAELSVVHMQIPCDHQRVTGSPSSLVLW